MARESIPAPDLAPPPIPEALTSAQRIEVWVDLMNACEQFLLAGFRRDVGPDGDIREAYQQWYNEQMKEHDRTIIRMVEEFNRRLGSRDG